jgi:hypothetical protein
VELGPVFELVFHVGYLLGEGWRSVLWHDNGRGGRLGGSGRRSLGEELCGGEDEGGEEGFGWVHRWFSFHG